MISGIVRKTIICAVVAVGFVTGPAASAVFTLSKQVYLPTAGPIPVKIGSRPAEPDYSNGPPLRFVDFLTRLEEARAATDPVESEDETPDEGGSQAAASADGASGELGGESVDDRPRMLKTTWSASGRMNFASEDGLFGVGMSGGTTLDQLLPFFTGRGFDPLQMSLTETEDPRPVRFQPPHSTPVRQEFLRSVDP